VLKFVLVVVVFALLVYGAFRMLDGRRAGGSTGQGKSKRSPGSQRRVVAPDDDEDFLRGLDRRRKRTGDSDGGDAPA
jgi:hypothetical protein